MITTIATRCPVERAPRRLREPAEFAGAVFETDPTDANWETYCAAIKACIDHDDRAQGRKAA